MKSHILFICSYNNQRSPAGADLIGECDNFETKSAGISPSANKRVSQELIDWADIIFVMNEKEDKHLSYVKNNFDIGQKKIIDLDIPDIYGRYDKRLVFLLIEKISQHLDLKDCSDKLIQFTQKYIKG